MSLSSPPTHPAGRSLGLPAGRPREAVGTGLMAGAILLLAALVGMIEAFSEEFIVNDVVTVGQAVWLGGFVAAGYLTGRHHRGAEAPVMGAMTGSSAAAVLAALVVLGNVINLRGMFINATPGLYALLTFGRGATGLLALVGSGAALAAGGAAIARLEDRPRRIALWAVVIVALMGTLQDTMRGILGPRNPLYGAVFAADGLSIRGAGALVIAIVTVALGVPALASTLESATAALPPGRRRHVRRFYLAAGALLAVAVIVYLPFAAGTYLSDVVDTVGLFILMGLGLNIVVGYAGLLDLGYVAFFAIGAYSVGALTSPEIGVGLGFWQALPVAILLSILSGVLLGIPVLKTHGDYLAIITLGFGEIIRILAISDWLKPLIGGAQGIKLIPLALEIPRFRLPLLGRIDPAFQQEVYFPIVAACGVGLYLAWRLRNSRYGRAWMAVREDEPVAEALGVNLVQTKLFAFATGAALAGTSGALFASKLQSIFPTSFNLLISINVLVLIIVGGMGSLPGVLVGALVLVGLPELLREFSDFRLLLYGALLVVMMLKRPEGLRPTTIAKRELAAGGPEAAPPVPGTLAAP